MTRADDSTVRDAFMELARAEAGPVVCEIWDRMDAARAEFERVMHALEMELHAAEYADDVQNVLAYDLHPFRVATGGWEIVNGDDVFLLPSERIAAQEDADDYQTQRFYDRAVLRILQAMSQLEAHQASPHVLGEYADGDGGSCAVCGEPIRFVLGEWEHEKGQS